MDGICLILDYIFLGDTPIGTTIFLDWDFFFREDPPWMEGRG